MARWLAFVYFTSFTVVGGLIPYLALELRARGIAGVSLAFAMGALPMGRLVAAPLWSLLADWLRAPGWVLRAGALVALAGASALWMGPLGMAVPAVFVFALGRAPMGPVVDTLTLETLGEDKGAYGRVRRWGSIGFLLATLASSILHDKLGVSPIAFGAVASAGLLVTVIALPTGGALARTRLGPALRSLGRDRVLWGVLIASALHFSAHIAATSFMAVHMDALGMATTWAGIALAFGVGVEVWIMSKAARLFAWLTPERAFFAAVVLALPRWLLTAITPSALGLVLLQGLHGFTFGAFWLAGVAIVSKRAPPEVAASAQGLFAASVGGVGALLGMVGGSFVVDTSPTHHVFLWGAGAAVLAILVTWKTFHDR
jgi:PPP family 3-phenylpropionic acid transporter